jgi:hypothetical protein
MWHVSGGVIKAAFPVEKADAAQFKSENDGKLLTAIVYSLKAKVSRTDTTSCEGVKQIV